MRGAKRIVRLNNKRTAEPLLHPPLSFWQIIFVFQGVEIKRMLHLNKERIIRSFRFGRR